MLKAKDFKMEKYFKNHILGWVAAICILWGYYLNANMYASSWLMWAVGNLFMGGYCFYKKAYPAAAMSFVLIILNVYGYLKWQ